MVLDEALLVELAFLPDDAHAQRHQHQAGNQNRRQEQQHLPAVGPRAHHTLTLF
jgi:hypothetical protein